MSVRVHIETLVLTGLPLAAEDGPAVQAAVEAELTRLLGEQGLGPSFRQGGALASVPGVAIHLPPTPAPDAAGRQIGTALHRSLRG